MLGQLVARSHLHLIIDVAVDALGGAAETDRQDVGASAAVIGGSSGRQLVVGIESGRYWMRIAWISAVIVFAGACGGTPSDREAGPAFASRNEVVKVLAEELPSELTFTISNAVPEVSAVTVVRTLRCEIVSPRDISMFEIRFPRLDMPDGWTALGSDSPFGAGIQKGRRYTWLLDLHRSSSSAPLAGDVQMTFSYGGPSEGDVVETRSNAVRIDFPTGHEPHAIRRADELRAAGQGFLLTVSEWGGRGPSRWIRLRPDGSFRAMAYSVGDAAIDNVGTLDADARARVASLLHRISVSELLAKPSDEFPASLKYGSGETYIFVAFAVGGGCSSRSVLGSTMRASEAWTNLTDLLESYTGVAVPGD